MEVLGERGVPVHGFSVGPGRDAAGPSCATRSASSVRHRAKGSSRAAGFRERFLVARMLGRYETFGCASSLARGDNYAGTRGADGNVTEVTVPRG